MTPDRLILILARSPRDERRHKPLGASVDGRRVEALHRALFERALDAAAAIAGARVRVVTTGDLGEMHALSARRIDAERLELARQEGEDLGARLHRAVEQAFADGYRQVVVTGGDAPGLRAEHLQSAFDRLEATGDQPRAVLGPALDGGYYLLGLSAFADAFTGVALSTPRAGAETERALARAGFSVETLAPLGDLDDLAGAIALAARLDRPADRALRDLLFSLLAPTPRWPARAAQPIDPFLPPPSARGPPRLD